MLSSKAVAKRWHVSRSQLNSYRRRLQLQLSWHEARAVSMADAERAHLSELKRRQMHARWAVYREQTTKRLLDLQHRMERQVHRAPIRVCRSCAYPWFALPTFFAVHRKKQHHRVKVSMAQTCRVCKMKLNHQPTTVLKDVLQIVE